MHERGNNMFIMYEKILNIVFLWITKE
jgi:hypothetical protein